MPKRLSSLLGTLLILLGALTPIGVEFAGSDGWALRLGTPAFAYSEEDGVWSAELGRNETMVFAMETNGSLALEDNMPSVNNMAPGDADPVGTSFRFTYAGTGRVRLYLTTSTWGDLTTCSGGGKFTVSIVDDDGQTYSSDEADQLVRDLDAGDSVLFHTVRQLDLSADDRCENKTGFFSIQGTVIEITDPEVPPTPPPPPLVPPTGAPVTGSLTVRVVESNSADGSFTPIADAAVILSDGSQSGVTDGSGTVTFDDLILGSYLVTGRAEDPQNPGSGDMQSGTASATLTQADPNTMVTIVLMWDRPLAPPDPDDPETPDGPDDPNGPTDPNTPTNPSGPGTPSSPGDPTGVSPSAGSIRVRVLDASPRGGGAPVPITGASVVLNAGLRAVTDGNGEALFADLPLGEYIISAQADDPQNPSFPDPRIGSSSTVIDAENPDETVTILLVWDQAQASPEGTGVAIGRVCAPLAPGSEVRATGPRDEAVTLFIAADGRLGEWRPYRLTNLVPGSWVISLKAPGVERVEQTVTVEAGATTQVPDFTLACTGDGPTASPDLWTYLVGGGLILGGLLLRRRGGPTAAQGG